MVDKFGIPDTDPETVEDYMYITGDWMDDMFSIIVRAEGHNISWKREGHIVVLDISEFKEKKE